MVPISSLTNLVRPTNQHVWISRVQCCHFYHVIRLDQLRSLGPNFRQLLGSSSLQVPELNVSIAAEDDKALFISQQVGGVRALYWRILSDELNQLFIFTELKRGEGEEDWCNQFGSLVPCTETLLPVIPLIFLALYRDYRVWTNRFCQ